MDDEDDAAAVADGINDDVDFEVERVF